MASSHFENRARREWWLVHIEAWRRSGLSRARYCRQHKLDEGTFGRWLKAIGDAKALEHKPHRKRRRSCSPLSKTRQSVAVQAFWAMHVEALNWSGQTATHYAAALRISAVALRRWRDLFEADEIVVDWRARLHPSALPKISSDVSSAAKDVRVESGLTDAPTGGFVGDRRSNRRRFTDEEKLAIVRESDAPGAIAVDVCRRHDIVTSMLFRWRVQFGYARKERVRLAAVRTSGALGECSRVATVLHDLLPTPDGMAAVDLLDGRRVFAPAGADPNTVRRRVAEQESAR